MCGVWCGALFVVALIVLAVLVAFGAAAPRPPRSLPSVAAPATRPAKSGEGDVLNFSLLDYRGNHYELRRADARLVVLFFTGADCPIARQNAPKLQALSEEFGPKGVAVWMVNATPQNDPTDAKLDTMFELGRIVRAA